MNDGATPPRDAPSVVVYDADSLYEVIDGQRVELPSMGAFETDLASTLIEYLRPFARSHQLGRVVAEMLFRLPVVGRERRPDVAFVSYQAWPSGRRVPRIAAWEVVPDLAVEVLSPTDKVVETFDKIDEYFRAGSRQVWMVIPSVEYVYVYSSPTQVRILTRADELTGEPLLPGFRMPLTQLFEEETDPA